MRDLGYMPEQVQDFYPTPSTISTCMYYTGVDPRTMEEVYVPVNPHEKAMQRALIQYRNPHNYDLVKEALIKAGRTDLIGFEEGCLIAPRKEHWREEKWDKKHQKTKNKRTDKTNDTGKSRNANSKKNDKSIQKQGKGRKNGKVSMQKGNTKGRKNVR